MKVSKNIIIKEVLAISCGYEILSWIGKLRRMGILLKNKEFKEVPTISKYIKNHITRKLEDGKCYLYQLSYCARIKTAKLSRNNS